MAAGIWPSESGLVGVSLGLVAGGVSRVAVSTGGILEFAAIVAAGGASDDVDVDKPALN